jgi:hypothetical protein
MAVLLNSRNQLLNAAVYRVLGAGVYITSGVATGFTLPTNATSAIPNVIVLTAIPSKYVVPEYIWYRRFGVNVNPQDANDDDYGYVAIPDSNSPTISVFGDQTFLTELGDDSIVQYKVQVTEISTVATNVSTATITLPILRQGSNAVLGQLTNDSQEVSVGQDGSVPEGTIIQSTLLIYNGTEDDSDNWSATIVASEGVTAELINGKTINVVLPLNTLNGYVDITATRQGYADIVKRFSISKVVAVSNTSLLLSKDTHIFNTNFEGVVSSYDGASTQIYVYNGSTDVSDLWTVAVTDHTPNIVFYLVDNTITLATVPTNIDSGYITITATRTGYSDLVKAFNFAKVKDAVTYNVVIESSNGDVFKPGQALETTLLARVFKNDQEVTDEIAANRFRWTRVSYAPQPPPEDDSTWNQTYSSGYKSIVLTISDVWQRATFHCDILE